MRSLLGLLHVALFAFATASDALEIYVHPTEPDGPHVVLLPGSLSVSSLPAARDAARAARYNEFDRGDDASIPRQPVAIRLLPGVHRLTGPLELDARDSGSTYQAFSARESGLSHTPATIVSGGVRVTGWKASTSVKGKRCYFLVFVPTIREIRDFYREM
eukprot:SAG31_NODE_379_length_16485_cov_3.654583_1_plen_160_part_00